MVKQGEAVPSSENAALYLFAEQLLDDPVQLANYDQAKWNLVGSPNPMERHEGRMPWLTRRDGQGALRAYTHDVFSGFSVDTKSLLTIRKDLWRDHEDTATWLAMESNLETGTTIQYPVWSASVDYARRLWLEVAPDNAWNQPVWYEHGVRKQAFRDRPASDQMRFTARLNEKWQTDSVEFKAGLRGGQVHYEDIVALESMIIAVQQVRAAQRDVVPVDGVSLLLAA